MIDRMGGDEGTNARESRQCSLLINIWKKETFALLHQRRAHSMQSPALRGIGHSNYGPIPHALALTHCELVKYAGYNREIHQTALCERRYRQSPAMAAEAKVF